MEVNMSEKYFIASNSAEGFYPYYGEVFDTRKFSQIYIIKGGSGIGKAYFMNECAKCAEKNGFSVRYIYCSSDAESLDGIIINEPRIAVLDGTAPHVYEPKVIGAVEHFVELSQFLDSKKLAGMREVIEKISAKKAEHFENAYRYLRAYRALSENIKEVISPCVKKDKIRAFAEKYARDITRGEGKVEHLLCRAIGMRGISSYPTYYENARIYYEINDYYESAHFLTEAITNAFGAKGADLRISSNPIMPERIDALASVADGLTFEIGNECREGSRIVNMKRFVDTEKIARAREEYREIVRARDEILHLTLSEFEKVKKHHFDIEKIYGSAMDFEAKERFTENFCRNLF